MRSIISGREWKGKKLVAKMGRVAKRMIVAFGDVFFLLLYIFSITRYLVLYAQYQHYQNCRKCT